MTVLSKISVIRALKRKQITIDPFDESNLDSDGSCTFTLGESISFLKYRRTRVDSRHLETVEFRQETIDKDGSAFVIPKLFFLLETAEHLKIGPKIFCQISTHPTMARIGMDMIQSSSLVPPMTDQRLVLEAFNHSANTITLYPRIKAVKAYFLRSN